MPTPTATPGPTPTIAAPSLPAAADTAFTDITLKGSGKKVAKFTIPVGSLAIAEATHVGKGNFAINSLRPANLQGVGSVGRTRTYDQAVNSRRSRGRF